MIVQHGQPTGIPANSMPLMFKVIKPSELDDVPSGSHVIIESAYLKNETRDTFGNLAVRERLDLINKAFKRNVTVEFTDFEDPLLEFERGVNDLIFSFQTGRYDDF